MSPAVLVRNSRCSPRAKRRVVRYTRFDSYGVQIILPTFPPKLSQDTADTESYLVSHTSSHTICYFGLDEASHLVFNLFNLNHSLLFVTQSLQLPDSPRGGHRRNNAWIVLRYVLIFLVRVLAIVNYLEQCPLETHADVLRHAREPQLDLLPAIELQFDHKLLELSHSSGVQVVTSPKIQNDKVNRRQAARIRNLHLLTETSDVLFSLDRPISLGLDTISFRVRRCMMSLNVIHHLCLHTIGIREEETFVEAEYSDVLWNGMKSARRVRNLRRFDGRDGARAGEDLPEEDVYNVEANSACEPDLRGHKETNPEGDHRRDEVGKRRFPVSIEGRWWLYQRPNSCNDDRRKSRFWDPVEGVRYTVYPDQHDRCGDDAGERALDFACAVHTRTAHCSANAHTVEEGVHHICDAVIRKLLSLVGVVVVL